MRKLMMPLALVGAAALTGCVGYGGGVYSTGGYYDNSPYYGGSYYGGAPYYGGGVGVVIEQRSGYPYGGYTRRAARFSADPRPSMGSFTCGAIRTTSIAGSRKAPLAGGTQTYCLISVAPKRDPKAAMSIAATVVRSRRATAPSPIHCMRRGSRPQGRQATRIPTM